MSKDKYIGLYVAKMLIEVEAVAFRPDNPFTLTSGRQSPVYIDCRKLISFPRLRSQLMDYAVDKIYRHIGYEAFEGIAGGETAGIPFAAWIAERMMLPMHYVRKKPKGFGKNAQIEGNIKANERILLVEDLASDAGSKKLFCDALRDADAICHHTFVIFYYDIFEHTPKMLDDINLSLHYLSTWWDVIEAMKQLKKYDNRIIENVESFLHDPEQWDNNLS